MMRYALSRTVAAGLSLVLLLALTALIPGGAEAAGPLNSYHASPAQPAGTARAGALDALQEWQQTVNWTKP